jgi:type IV secretory pathway VirD2 relaxase
VSHPNDLEQRLPLRPKMGKRPGARDRVAASTMVIGRLVRLGHGRRGPGRARRAHVPVAAPGFAPRRNARRVVIKAHVQHLSRSGAQAAARHLRYIERDGVEKDGSPGRLYGPEGPVAREAFEEPRLGERHQFRFIVSPEDGGDLDLTAYARSLMSRVERDLGRRIEWAAVNHYDTDHPHAHVVVRGVDLDGQQLFMQPAYIARGMRWSAQELATDWLGPRLEQDIQQTYEREVLQERETSLDRELARLAPDRRVDAAAFEAREGYPQPETLVRRLKQLEQLGLAERAEGTTWELADGWRDSLRELGFRGDRLKQIHRAMNGSDPTHVHVVGPGQGIPDGHGGVVEGPLVARLLRKGLTDESKGTYYGVLETPTGAVYHVPLSGHALDALEPATLVTVTARIAKEAVRPIDEHLTGAAGQRGGVYELARDARSDDAQSRAARARLGQLERLGLATQVQPSRWQLPENLIEELERRQREAPRYRISIEPMAVSVTQQIARRGPVWLDHLDSRTLSDGGFGAEVRVALAGRRQVLDELGISPEDPERVTKLREFERRAVGRELAGRVGQAFIEQTPAGFRGRVRGMLREVPYAVVTEGRRFVLVEATAEVRACIDRNVELQRSKDGRVVVVDDEPRRALGAEIARRTQDTFLSEIPDGFRGTVSRGPKGVRYLVVSDDRSGRFVLVPDSPDARVLLGKRVEIGRNPDGHVLGLRPDGRDRGLAR